MTVPVERFDNPPLMGHMRLALADTLLGQRDQLRRSVQDLLLSRLECSVVPYTLPAMPVRGLFRLGSASV